MAKISKLADIDIYREALALAQDTYALSRNSRITRDYSLIDQMRRACLSIAANIAEGYGRKTKRDFAQFLSVSLGSVNEVMTYLDFIQPEYHLDTSALKAKYDVLAKRIFSFRSYLFSS